MEGSEGGREEEEKGHEGEGGKKDIREGERGEWNTRKRKTENKRFSSKELNGLTC